MKTSATQTNFKIGDPVRISGASKGTIVALVKAGESPKWVLQRVTAATGEYLYLASEGVARDHDSYIVQVGTNICRFPEVRTLSLDRLAVLSHQNFDQRRKQSFKAEVVVDENPYVGGSNQKPLLLRVTWNGDDWKSLPLLPREIPAVIKALQSVQKKPGSEKKAGKAVPKTLSKNKISCSKRK